MESDLVTQLSQTDTELAKLADDMGININEMSEQERRVFFQVLEEMADTGDSETLDNLYYADYDEVPVDIDTFISDPEYFGAGTEEGNLIYPFWKKELRKIFAPGSKFFEICITGGIGLGKSTIAVIGLGYMLYKLLCLKNPQEYYGLTKSSIIGIAFFNITLD